MEIYSLGYPRPLYVERKTGVLSDSKYYSEKFACAGD